VRLECTLGSGTHLGYSTYPVEWLGWAQVCVECERLPRESENGARGGVRICQCRLSDKRRVREEPRRPELPLVAGYRDSPLGQEGREKGLMRDFHDTYSGRSDIGPE